MLWVLPSLNFEVLIDGHNLDEALEGIILNDVTFYRNHIFLPSGAAADMLQIFKWSLMDVERRGTPRRRHNGLAATHALGKW